MNKLQNRILAVVATILGVTMSAGGLAKLSGEPRQVASFAAWGLPLWFRALVGTFEVLGGILLLVPATTPVGSLVLSTIMVGALWTHIASAEWSHVVPVLGVLTVLLLIFRRSRGRMITLLGVH